VNILFIRFFCDSGLVGWQIALIVVGSVLGVAIIGVIIFLIWKFGIKSSSSAAISSTPKKSMYKFLFIY
jgi:hypothetical protein